MQFVILLAVWWMLGRVVSNKKRVEPKAVAINCTSNVGRKKMSREKQPDMERLSLMSDDAICTCIANDRCPLCMADLDTGFECNGCGFDAMPLAQTFGQDRLQKARMPVAV